MEIKNLYGGPPPQAILDVEARDITMERDPPFEAREALEAVPDLEDIDVDDKTGSESVQEVEGKSAE
jgi:hypothetical protein